MNHHYYNISPDYYIAFLNFNWSSCGIYLSSSVLRAYFRCLFRIDTFEVVCLARLLYFTIQNIALNATLPFSSDPQSLQMILYLSRELNSCFLHSLHLTSDLNWISLWCLKSISNIYHWYCWNFSLHYDQQHKTSEHL